MQGPIREIRRDTRKSKGTSPNRVAMLRQCIAVMNRLSNRRLEVARKDSPAIAIDRAPRTVLIARRLDEITRSRSSRDQSPNFGEAAAMQNSREPLSSFPTESCAAYRAVQKS